MEALVSISLLTSLASPVCSADVGPGIGVGVGLALVSQRPQQPQQHKRNAGPKDDTKIIAIITPSFILGPREGQGKVFVGEFLY